MKKTGILLASILCLLSLSGRVFCQTDSVSVSYDQILDTRTYRVEGSLLTDSNPWNLTATTYGEAIRRRLSHYQEQWKTDVGVIVHGTRDISDNLQFLLHLKTQDFRDREAEYVFSHSPGGLFPDRVVVDPPLLRPIIGSNNHIGRSSARGGIEYSPTSDIDVRILGGVAWDEQLYGSGNGPSLEGNFLYSPMQDEQMELDASARLNQYNNRQNHAIQVRGMVQESFGESIDELRISYSNNRADEILTNLGNVMTRLDESVFIDNRLITPLERNISATYDIQYRQSKVDYRGGGPGTGLEKDFRNAISLSQAGERHFAIVSYSFSIEDRDFGGGLILGRRQILGFNGGLMQGHDSLSFRYNTEKLRYDSPDSLELSDRDRLMHRFRMTGNKWVTPEFNTYFEASVLLDHIVNLEAQRSADNRWNRVFRISPGVIWDHASGWRNRTIFEVLANYSSYDFEIQTLGGSSQSTVFRRWSVSDTLRVPILSTLSIETSIRFDLEDRGRLQWDDFIQELSDEAEARFLAANLESSALGWLIVRIGYRQYRRLEFQMSDSSSKSNQRTRSRSYQSRGPTFRISTPRHASLRLWIDGSLLDVEDSNRDNAYKLDSFSATLVYYW